MILQGSYNVTQSGRSYSEWGSTRPVKNAGIRSAKVSNTYLQFRLKGGAQPLVRCNLALLAYAFLITFSKLAGNKVFWRHEIALRWV